MLASRRILRNPTPASGPQVVQTFANLTPVTNVNAGPLSASPSQATVAGHPLVVVAKFGGGIIPATPTDSKSNTYTRDVNSTASGPVVAIFHCASPVSLSTSDTVTVNDSGQGNWGFIVFELSGITGSFDKSGTAGPTSTGSLTCSQGTTTTHATEIAITAFGEGGSPPSNFTATPSAGWTQVQTSNAACCAGYQVLSATGTQSVTWSASNSNNCCAAIATYS